MATQIGPLKIGGDKPWKIYAGVGGSLIAVFLFVRMLVETFGGGPAPAPVAPVATKAAPVFNSANKPSGPAAQKKAAANGSQSPDPTLRFDLLAQSENVVYSGNGRNVFSLTAPPPPIPVAIASARTNTAPQQPVGPPPPPPKPKIMLTFYGYESSKGAGKRIFLINPQQDVFIAAEGDIVDRRYKVVKISTNSVDIQDILNDDTQTIHLASQPS